MQYLSLEGEIGSELRILSSYYRVFFVFKKPSTTVTATCRFGSLKTKAHNGLLCLFNYSVVGIQFLQLKLHYIWLQPTLT